MSGEFEWNVIAFDLNGDAICISESALFTKPAKPQNNGSGGNGVDGSIGGEGPPPHQH